MQVWQPTPVLLPEKSHGLRSFVGYSPWRRKELDTTEQLHFCVLILYLASLLNSLISSNNFLILPLEFCMYSIMSSANCENFNSSFPTWVPFISFSSLIAVGRTSRNMLNNSG